MLFPQNAAPGYTDIFESGEWEGILNALNRETLTIVSNVQIDSTAADAGNTPTTTLRAGSVLAQKASDSNYYLYDPDATDGTQIAKGVLPIQLSMLGASGVAEDKWVNIIIRGNFQASQLHNLDATARQQLILLGCVFDAPAGSQGLPGPVGIEQVATNTTLVAADNGKLFIATAAATFTLPTKANGLVFEFLQTADANMVISSAGSADDIIVDGDAGADTITYSTASHKIGSRGEIRCVYVGADLKWIYKNLGGTAMTIA